MQLVDQMFVIYLVLFCIKKQILLVGLSSSFWWDKRYTFTSCKKQKFCILCLKDVPLKTPVSCYALKDLIVIFFEILDITWVLLGD